MFLALMASIEGQIVINFDLVKTIEPELGGSKLRMSEGRVIHVRENPQHILSKLRRGNQ